ncbi:YhbY family RNA-binding protein [Candidatus Woesearchaeota archaeon]|nr:YhbY family RNA-binding protein [Candidatus Woesearchaeota archaeon]
MDIKELKSKGQTLKPIVRIGKNGLTDMQVIEIKKHLQKRKLVKIKMLKALIEDKGTGIKDMMADEICAKTGAQLVQRVGFTVLIYKE